MVEQNTSQTCHDAKMTPELCTMRTLEQLLGTMLPNMIRDQECIDVPCRRVIGPVPHVVKCSRYVVRDTYPLVGKPDGIRANLAFSEGQPDGPVRVIPDPRVM